MKKGLAQKGSSLVNKNIISSFSDMLLDLVFEGSDAVGFSRTNTFQVDLALWKEQNPTFLFLP